MSPSQLAAESAELPEQAFFTIEDTPKARPLPRTAENRGLVRIEAALVFRAPQLIGVVYCGILLNRNNELADTIATTI